MNPSQSPVGEELKARKLVYEAGVVLFNSLRTFIGCAGVNPSKCRVTVELPDKDARKELVNALRASAPPIGEWRASGAQAGNFSGVWQGIEYEWTVATRPAVDLREDRELVKQLREFARIFATKNGAKLDIVIDAADRIEVLHARLQG